MLTLSELQDKDRLMHSMLIYVDQFRQIYSFSHFHTLTLYKVPMVLQRHYGQIWHQCRQCRGKHSIQMHCIGLWVFISTVSTNKIPYTFTQQHWQNLIFCYRPPRHALHVHSRLNEQILNTKSSNYSKIRHFFKFLSWVYFDITILKT